MKNVFLIVFFLYVSLHGVTIALEPSNFGEPNAGTEENPYLISNLANLRWLSENESTWGSITQKNYFKQTAEIDASETRMWNEGKGFSQIGESDFALSESGEIMYPSAFHGSYDGGNWAIKNIFMTQKTNNFDNRFVGFFCVIQNSELKNIRLENILYVFDGIVIGALCNIAVNSSIINSSVTGTIILNDLYGDASGLISSGFNITIDRCFSTVNLICPSGDGYGATSGIGRTLHASTLSNSYYHGVMLNPGPLSSAGLVRSTAESEIINCYAIVATNSRVSGLVDTPIESKIIRSYFQKSSMVKKPFHYGKFVHIINYLVEKYTPVKEYSGRGLSPRKMKMPKSFKGWDFEDIWIIDPDTNNGFPYINPHLI